MVWPKGGVLYAITHSALCALIFKFPKHEIIGKNFPFKNSFALESSWWYLLILLHHKMHL